MPDMHPDKLASLVVDARNGDKEAWGALVERYSPLIWSVVRGYRLTRAEAEDVAQSVWLRLLESLPQVRDPATLGGWLATTARREATRVLRQRTLTEDADPDDEPVDPAPTPEESVVTSDRRAELLRAFRQLSPGCQGLLRMLVTDPQPTYAEVSAALNVPVGSIGPTRSRCLAHLRRLLLEDLAEASEPALIGALRSGNVGVSRVPASVVDDAEALAARPDRPEGNAH